MQAFPARENGKLIYVDRAGAVVLRTRADASLHVANYTGAVDLSAPRPVERDGRWGYLTIDGTLRSDARYDGASQAVEGRSFVGHRVGTHGRGGAILHWRMIDDNERYLGTEVLSDFRLFSDGVAPARARNPDDPLDQYGLRHRLWGLLDRDGSWRVTPRWDWLAAFCEGRAAASLDGKDGFIDREGTWVVEPRYDVVTDFSGGLAQVGIADGLSTPTRDEATGRLVITPGFVGRFGVVDSSGALLLPVEAHAPVLGLRRGQEVSEGVAIIEEVGKLGFIDVLTGRTIVEPTYDYALPFSEGRALVRRGKKDGFIDRLGHEVVPISLPAAHSFSEGLAGAQEMVAVLDARGKKSRRARWGFIDPSGAWIVPPTFGPVSSFHDGLALVWLDETRLGYVDRTGQLIWQEKARPEENVLASPRAGG